MAAGQAVAIRPLIAHQVFVVDPRVSLAKVARKMHAGGVGSAVVMSDQGPGIITDAGILSMRDVVAAMLEILEPASTTG
jgi:CBS domain-containing protein